MTSLDRIDVTCVGTKAVRVDAWGEVFAGGSNTPHGEGRTVIMLDAGQAMALSRLLAKAALGAGWRDVNPEDLA